jgi:hypothetical protein
VTFAGAAGSSRASISRSCFFAISAGW